MKEVVVLDVVRTPIGKRGGALSQVEPIRSGARVLNEVVRRAQARVSTSPCDLQTMRIGQGQATATIIERLV